MGQLSRIALLCGLAMSLAGTVAAEGGAKTPPSGLYAAPTTLQGTLGETRIQMRLRPKTDEEGLEGEYFRFGASARVLLAGEVEGVELVMEESENGTDVSGQWLGTIDGRRISGTWQNADGSVSLPFSLSMMPAEEKRAPSRPAVRPGAAAR
jgi:hypothetical protein